jgi:hypothetical protein
MGTVASAQLDDPARRGEVEAPRHTLDQCAPAGHHRRDLQRTSEEAFQEDKAHQFLF